MIGGDYSSKFSPWMANGCLSVKQIYHETKRYEKEVTRNESTKHYVDELYWRDFFKYFAMAWGNEIFFEAGTTSGYKNWEVNEDKIMRWKEGRTGMPIIDAFMRELNTTGYMSNRGRQIVGSYLALDLK
jgi:deoxyribodipyrimidine photo-lyase